MRRPSLRSGLVVLTAAVLVSIGVLVMQPRPLAPLADAAGRVFPGTGELWLPNQPGSLKFAVMGDVGRGDQRQYETAAEMARWHERFEFELVLMLGDNIYGPGTPDDYALRFERPYAPLLDRGVKFRAVLGNHDPPGQEAYEPFGMDGHRYYSFTRTAGPLWSPRQVQFLALDTGHLDAAQVAWIRSTLASNDAGWKIALFHHPIYTSGDYRWRAAYMRVRLEELFVTGGLDVGFSGHEHFYERLQPQHGVQYFISGAGGALRVGALIPSAVTAAGFDRDTHFMLIEINGDTLWFQTVSRIGATVDYGERSRRGQGGRSAI